MRSRGKLLKTKDGKSDSLSSVELLSRVRLFRTPWTTAHQAFLSITNSRSLLRLISIESVMPSNHLILCHSLLLLPSIFPSIRVFSDESALCIRLSKYWSLSFNISPSNEHPGLISFRMDRLDLLAVQGTLKSLLQHHSSKASILQCSAFFIVQLLHSYMTTGKTIALMRQTFVGKVMSLLFNMQTISAAFNSSCRPFLSISFICKINIDSVKFHSGAYTRWACSQLLFFNDNPLQYSCLRNSIDRWTLRATVHGVTKSRTWLSN